MSKTSTCRRFAGTSLCVATALGFSACSSDRDADWSGQVDTLPGGALHVVNPAEGAWTPGQEWTLTEDLRLGSIDGDADDAFSNIGSVLTDADGRLYIMEILGTEIRVYDSTGAFLHTIGRAGDGPGEVGGATGIRASDEGIWILDFGSYNYHLYATSGEHIRSRRRRVNSGLIPWRGVISPSGIVDFGVGRMAGAEESSNVIVRHAVDGDDPPADTLPVPTYSRPGLINSRTGEREASVPFSPALEWGLSPAGDLWYGVSDAYRLVGVNLSGDTVGIVERRVDPIPISSTEFDAAVERIRENEEIDPGVSLDPERMPDSKAQFLTLNWDSEGNLWVRVPPGPDGGSAWDVFDTDHRYLGRVETSVELIELVETIADDVLFGVTKDEFDVNYVVRLRIDKPQE